MRKFLLLSVLACFTFGASAQIDTLEKQDFENGVPTGWLAYGSWKDTTLVSVSPNKSLRNRGSQVPFVNVYQDSLELPSFSTQNGNRFVFLSFYHIAKYFLFNNIRVETSIDDGATWVAVVEDYYRGPSLAFNPGQIINFTEATYAGQGNPWQFGAPPNVNNSTPINSWWRQESFDLTDIFEGPTGAGYPNCKIRFVATYNSAQYNYFAGWYVDDLLLLRSSCELTSPTLDFDYPQATVCIANKPENGVVQDAINNEYYAAVAAYDDSSGIANVVLRWREVGTTTWNVDTMSPTTYTPFINGITYTEYIDTMSNVFLGDTIEWFVRAYDNACPNVTRSPDSLIQDYYTYWPEPGYPTKCGNPYCGVLPTVVANFPWVEDFESPEFGAGSGPGTGNALYRGTFPAGDITGKYWTVNPPQANQGYAWSVRAGTTFTQLTGPDQGHTPSGSQYLYVEADQTSNSFTNLVTPCLDLRAETGCMAWEFWYHMFGENVNLISIEVDDGVNGANFTPIDTIMGEQQDSGSQAWKRHVVDLTPYVGSFIRLRLKAVRSIGSLGDMAIDDFRVFKPSTTEFELLDFRSPLAGGCSYNNEDVTVVYRHAGCDTASFIPMAYQVNGGTIVRDTLFGQFTLGDTGSFTFSNQVSMTAIGSYDIQAWVDDQNDGDNTNDTIDNVTVEVKPLYSNFPVIEKFEDGTVGTRNFNFSNPVFELVNGQDAAYGWQVGQELTPTRNTGPWRGYYFDYDGKYLYTSASAPGGGTSSGNLSTYLQTTNCLDFSGMTSPMMTFMFHMYGTNINSFEIEYSEGIGGENWLPLPNSTVTRASQQAVFTSEVSDWQVNRVDLSQFAGQSVKIRIKSNRTGTGLLTDLAIDNLHIFDRAANDVGISRIRRPNIAVREDGALDPFLRVENYTNSAITSVPIVIEIIPLCNQGAPQIHTQTIAANIPANGSADVTFDFATATPPLTYPVGEFVMKAYTNLAGDGFAYNDTVTKHATRIGRFPLTFEDNFDSCAYSSTGFAPTGDGFRQWELGQPGAPFINGFSSPNAWTVNREGAVVPNTSEVLLLPYITGFDSVVAVEIGFRHNSAFGGSAAGTIEYSTSSGWEPLVGLDPTRGLNWFGSSVGVLNEPLINNSPGWNNAMDNQGWMPSFYPISFYNFSTLPLVLRYRFSSGTSANPGGGWSIDNFRAYVPPQHSASPVNVRTTNPLPIPGNDQPLEITVQNTGKQLIYGYIQEVIWDVNTANPVKLGADTIVFDSIGNTRVEGTLIKKLYNFVVPGSLATAGVHDVCVVTSRPSSRQDEIPFDDTLCVQIRVLDEFEFTSTDTSYCNNFDGNLGNLEFFGLNNYTYEPGRHSWEQGTPVQFPSAFSAPNVWMTDLDSNYKSRDSSALFTPVFVVEQDTNYQVNFMHYFETEKNTDGGTFMVSDNSGLTWQTIGFSAESKWYNTRFINALDILKPGWSDTSGGWDSAQYVFRFEQGDRVIFKFRFESDWDIQYPGWAIDDFCLKPTSQDPGYVIGQEEYNPVNSVFFGELAPNPTRSRTVLPFTIADNKQVNILVTNMMGQLIEQRTESFSKGANAIRFDTDKWRSGLYNIVVEMDGTVINRKLIVQH